VPTLNSGAHGLHEVVADGISALHNFKVPLPTPNPRDSSMKSSPAHGCARNSFLAAGVLFALLSFAGAAPARGSGFKLGDLYLLSPTLPNGALTRKGILRVDPLSGVPSLLVDLTSNPGFQRTFTYDASRDRLLYCDALATGGITAVDATGATTSIAPTTATPLLIAARGDGKVYLWYSGPEGFSVMDGAGTVSNLLDQAGTARFGFGQGKLLEEMIYVPSTNSLLCLAGSIGMSPCSNTSEVCVLSVPLDAAGTQVSGPVSSAQFEVSTSGETVVGSALGPSSSVLITVDTNSNSQEPRMLLVDPATLGISVFASNGPYTGAAATNAGTYSHLTGRAVVVDTFKDSLRAFGFGETGLGTSITPNVSISGSSGESPRLIEINSAGLVDVSQPIEREQLRLASPAPNPFRATTVLRWAQPAAAHVTFTVIDVMGRKVRTLLEAASLPAGEHTVTWDGRSDAGQNAPAGVYHAVLSVDGRRELRAIVRLR
jgi:FlgD Ig-like domain